MELILWRHAEAKEGSPDLARALSPKGMRQAREMAAWLKGQFEGPVRVLSSPAVRTRQTADALKLPYEIACEIGPDASVDQLLSASNWPNGHGLVILVGHNPTITALAKRLAVADGLPFEMRRAAAWWFVSAAEVGDERAILKTAMAPALLAHD